MLTIACVLRSGGEYTREHAEELYRTVYTHLADASGFTILTDDLTNQVDGATARSLIHHWPGWWAKMELFSIKGPVLYLDLDTWVVGNLAPLVDAVRVLPHDAILMLEDFYSRKPASGVMGWSGDLSWIYEAFRKEIDAGWFQQKGSKVYAITERGKFRGDQDWLRKFIHHKRVPVAYAQRMVQGIYSYKRDVQKNRGRIPDGAILVCFHGNPRPWQVEKPKERSDAVA